MSLNSLRNLRALRYIWVADSEGYGRAAKGMQHGLLPVITPADPARQELWTQVLEWYGLDHSEHSGTFPATTASVTDQDNVVISLDRNLDTIAAAYAAVQGRPFITIDVVQDMERVVDSAFKSLLFYGNRHQFGYAHLQDLQRLTSVPWGIVTGKDDAAIAFVTSKLLAAGNLPNLPWAALDMLDKWCWEWQPDGEPCGRAGNGCGLPEAIVEGDWNTLALHAHGEGGHANLDNVVLCGALGSVEVGSHGVPLKGCGVVNGERRCKRVHSSEVRIFPFSHLRAHRLCLFSCNGFSVASELYPSDVSCVLAAAEGYLSAVLSHDRTVPTSHDIVNASIRLLRQGVAMGSLLYLLNDLRQRSFACRPCVLFGDPIASFGNGSSHAVASNQIDSTCATDAVTVQVYDNVASGVAVGQATISDVDVFVGMRTVVVAPKADACSGSIELIDYSSTLRSAVSFGTELARRASDAGRIERAIRVILPATGRRIDDSQQARLAELVLLRERVESAAQDVLRHCTTIQRTGVWETQLEQRRSMLTLYSSLWDQSFARFISDYLFEAELEDILLDCCIKEDRMGGMLCDRCRCIVTLTNYSNRLDRHAGYIRHDCPVCGPREVCTQGADVIRLIVPQYLRASTTAIVDVRVEQAETHRAQHSNFGYLSAEFKDKGKATIFYRVLERIERGSQQLHIPIPADLTSDLHTFRLAYVHLLTVAVQRRRVPGIVQQ